MFNHHDPFPCFHCLVYNFAFCFLFLIYMSLHKSTPGNLIHKASRPNKKKKAWLLKHIPHAPLVLYGFLPHSQNPPKPHSF